MKVLRRYHIQVREDYMKYNRMVGQVHQIVHKLTKLPADDEYRIRTAEQMMNKLSVLTLVHIAPPNFVCAFFQLLTACSSDPFLVDSASTWA